MAIKELLRIVVDADTDGAVKSVNKFGAVAEKDLGKAETRIDRVGAGFRRTGAVMLGAGAVAAAGLLKSVDATADLEQAVGGTEAVFGDAREAVDAYAKTSAQAMGLSEREFREATTSIGGQLKRMTGDVDLAAAQSVELTRTAADLAATYGGTTAEAVQALGAAFRGEADPAERFNLNLKAGAVNAKAVELGLAASTTEVDEAAKAQATLALIAEQSADAQGQFAREADTVAGAQQRASAEFENAQAALGEALAPAMATASQFAGGMAGKFTALNESTGGLASQAALGATAFLLVGGALSTAIGQAIKMRDSFSAVKTAMSGISFRQFATGAAAIAAAGVALKLYTDMMDDAREAGEEQVSALRKQWDELDNGEKSVKKYNDVLAALDHDIEGLSDTIAGSQAPWDHDKRAEMKAARSEAEKFREELVAERDAIAKLSDQMGISSTEAAKIISSQGGLAEVVDETTGEFDEQATAVNANVSALEDLESALKAQFDPLFGMLDAQKSLTEAQVKAKEASDKYGASSIEAAAANDAAVRAALGNETAQIRLKAALENGDVSLADAVRSLDRWVDQGVITEDQASQMAWMFGEATGKAQEFDGTYNAHITASGYDEVIRKLNDLKGRIFGLSAAAFSFRVPGSGFASGGEVPGAPGQPVPITAHGGEVVLSREVVDSIKKGGPNSHLGGGRALASPAGSDARSRESQQMAGDRTYNITVSDERDVMRKIDFFERVQAAGI